VESTPEVHMTNATPDDRRLSKPDNQNRNRVRVPSSPIDVLARHLEHITVATDHYRSNPADGLQLLGLTT
jgi:hypothetical protein